MKFSKPIVILSSLEQKQINDFVLYVNHTSTDQYVNKLVHELSLLYPNYTDKTTESKKLYEKVFKNERYNDKKFRYLLSDTCAILEQFLYLENCKQDSFLKTQKLLEIYNGLNTKKYFQQHLNAFEKQKTESVFRNSTFYFQQAQIDEQAFLHFSTFDDRNLTNDLQTLTTSIDIAYLSKKLIVACEMINQQNILQVNYDLSFVVEVFKHVEQTKFMNVPAINVYYSAFNMLRNGLVEENYIQFKKTLYTNASLFPVNEQRTLFTYLQNYCIKKLNKGDVSALNELFENYNYMLDHHILIEGKKISQFDFKNISTLALRLNKFEWVEEFIRNYERLLAKEFRENAVTYNLSRLAYFKREYKNALKLMQDVEFNDVYYHLDAKVLLLKIYFDTDDEDGFLSLLSSFKIYLKRNKQVSKYQYNTYYNFCLFSHKLFKEKMGSSNQLEKIKLSLQANENIADVNWLLHKIVELE